MQSRATKAIHDPRNDAFLLTGLKNRLALLKRVPVPDISYVHSGFLWSPSVLQGECQMRFNNPLSLPSTSFPTSSPKSSAVVNGFQKEVELCIWFISLKKGGSGHSVMAA
jgi:hypothetical protein